ncbi:MAG: Sec-independent protein translocase TatB [Actinomycetota bacterium]
MFGINGAEFVVLIIVALLVIGPERLPEYSAQLARFVKQARRFALDAREQVRSELGPDFDDVDWRKLDPRQYDPRRIVRDALQDAWDDEPVKPTSRRPPARPSTPGPAPFDDEAT